MGNWEVFSTIYSLIKQQNERWDDFPDDLRHALKKWRELEL